jgi:hypothetical protein
MHAEKVKKRVHNSPDDMQESHVQLKAQILQEAELN